MNDIDSPDYHDTNQTFGGNSRAEDELDRRSAEDGREIERLQKNVTALRAELAKVRGELEVIQCPTTHQTIVKQIIADRARLEAACLVLRTALTDIRDMKEYDQDDQYRLRQIAKQALLITP